MPNNNFDPTSLPGVVPAQGSSASFDPTSLPGVVPAVVAAPNAPATGGNPLAAFAGGALNFVNNNPVSKSITSLAALPVQLGVKAINAAAGTHYPDPYAGGIGIGPGAPQVTSSDQSAGGFAEQEAGNALTAASLFVPAARVAEGAAPFLSPALGRFAPAAARVGTQSVLGALQGLAGGMQQGQSGADLKNSAEFGATLSGGLSTAGEFGSALLSSLASNTAESRLGDQMNRLKTLQNSYDDNSTFVKDPTTGVYVAQTNPVKTLTDTGLIKGLTVVDGRVNTDGVETGIQNMLAAQDSKAAELVAAIPGNVSLEDYKNAVVDAVKNNPQIRDAGKVQTALAEVERRFADYGESFGENVTYPQLNNIRIAMNREFNPEMRDVARTIGDSARTMLYDKATGSPELQDLMATQGQLLKAQNFVDRLRGTVVRGGRLGKYLADMVGSGVGTAIGATFGPVGMAVGSVLGAAATDRAMGTYQNNFFNPITARMAGPLDRFVSGSTAQAVSRLGKATLIPTAVQK